MDSIIGTLDLEPGITLNLYQGDDFDLSLTKTVNGKETQIGPRFEPTFDSFIYHVVRVTNNAEKTLTLFDQYLENEKSVRLGPGNKGA